MTHNITALNKNQLQSKLTKLIESLAVKLERDFNITNKNRIP